MSRPRPTDLLSAGLIVAAVFAVYANAFRGTFQFDDWNVIVHDPRVQSLSAWWTSMPGIRPLLKLFYAVNHESGLGLAGFHAINVALHATNALLVLALLSRLAARADDDGRMAALAPTAGALLFALHPVQTEAVTYVSGRSTSLCALFALGSIVTWLAGREQGRRGLSLVVSPLLLAAALSVKEIAVPCPWRCC